MPSVIVPSAPNLRPGVAFLFSSGEFPLFCCMFFAFMRNLRHLFVLLQE
jgi:hypothetical protein